MLLSADPSPIPVTWPSPGQLSDVSAMSNAEIVGALDAGRLDYLLGRVVSWSADGATGHWGSGAGSIGAVGVTAVTLAADAIAAGG